MLYIGKLIGTLLGFLMAGPYGALFGLIIGYFFDKSLHQHLNLSYPSFHQEQRENVNTAFVKAISCLMGLMAKADGRVSESELNFANYVFRQLKINQTQIITAKQWFTASKNGQVSLEDHTRLLQYLKEMNLSLCKYCFDIAYQMAKIDGLDSKKIFLLNQLLTNVGFIEIGPFQTHHSNWGYQTQNQQQRRQYQKQEYTPPPKTGMSLDQAYTTLNIDLTANKTQVKRAYRKLISQFHPDKMIAKGASKQEIKAATEKTQQISKAYQLICDTKGW